MTSAPIRVLLADADPLQREGWRLVLDAQPDLEVVAEVPDGVQALAVLRRTAVDVAVVDVRMPRLGGVQVTEAVATDARIRLMQHSPVTRVVLVTATDLDRYAGPGRAAGADAVLYKDADPAELSAAIRDAAAFRTIPAS
ncbi:response regulator [Amnibacterium kyonggiense]|uniref:Response regulator receiver domain-containing protein n=1 Tax=Amnibacterium kyonggiense TaxID=595671 RepID=A0A4R7FM97_9MICO|nr:response regulator transcription factor [Amnibacterium kyonggiense]TDS77581.1 response regulator receiver domain-containing protein [Amnibacterium kyonggiense]